jgi:branched-chain amino acid transport system permease protein
VQTFAVGATISIGSVATMLGISVPSAWAALTLTQLAPVLPYLLLVAMLAIRPRGLLGERVPDA